MDELSLMCPLDTTPLNWSDVRRGEKYEKIWNSSELIVRIGNFYVRATTQLLAESKRSVGISAFSQTDRTGDLYHRQLNSVLEVKGSSSRNSLRIFADQLEKHLVDVEASFPKHRNCLYVLWQYNNCKWIDGQRCRILSPHAKEQSKLERFLLENTTSVYVIDSALLKLIHEACGVRPDGYGSEFGTRSRLNFTLKKIQDISINTASALHDFGMNGDASKYLRKGETAIPALKARLYQNRRRMSFDLYTLVPIEQRQVIENLIASNGSRVLNRII